MSRVRFAPSPTGSLHVGNALTRGRQPQLRRHGCCCGSTTPIRRATSPGGEEAILRDLDWLGIELGRGAGPPERAAERHREAAGDALGGRPLRRHHAPARGRHADVPARERRRRHRLRDHARHPRHRPPPERGAAPARCTRRSAATPPEYVHHGLVLGADGQKLSKRDPGASSLPICARPASPPRPCAHTSRSSACRAHDVQLDLTRLRRLAIETIAALQRRGARRARRRRVELAPALRGARDLVEAREFARSILEPRAGLAAGRGAADARAVPRAARARERRARRGRGEGARPRAEGRRRRPSRAPARAHRRASEGPSCGRSSPPCARRDAAAHRRPAIRSPPCGSTTPARGRRTSCRPRPVRSACTSAGRPCTARIHVGNAVPFVIPLWLEALARAERATRRRSSINITDINDKIYDAAPGESARLAEEATSWYLEDTDRLGLGPARLRADRRGHRRRPDRDDRGADRARVRLRGGRRRLLPRSRGSRATARCRASGSTRWTSKSRTRGRRTRATSRSGRRTSPARTRGGTRRGAAAGPAGTSSARRCPRSISAPSSRSTAAGSISSSRTTRTRSRSRRRSVTRSRGSGCTTACSGSPARRCTSPPVTTCPLKDALDRWGRETLLVFFLSGHWRKPMDYLGRDAGGRRARGQRRSARCSANPSEPAPERAWDRFAEALEDDFNTPEALVVMHEWRRPRPAAARARRVRARLAGGAGRGAGGAARAGRAAAGGARPAGTSRQSDRLREEIEAAGLGGARPPRRRLRARSRGSDARARLRPAGRPRGAARTAARCSSCWATERAAEGRAVAGGRAPTAAPREAGAGADRGGGHARSPGRRSRTASPTGTRTPTSSRPPTCPCSRASTR